MSKHALDLPEVSHMLDVLTGSQSALSELLKCRATNRLRIQRQSG